MKITASRLCECAAYCQNRMKENKEMSQVTVLSEDHPMMMAWEVFSQTEEFANALKWAVAMKYDDERIIADEHRTEHAKGAMWLAFTKGWMYTMSREESKKWACADCGAEYDTDDRCVKCGGFRVVLTSVLVETFGPHWKKLL